MLAYHTIVILSVFIDVLFYYWEKIDSFKGLEWTKSSTDGFIRYMRLVRR